MLFQHDVGKHNSAKRNARGQIHYSHKTRINVKETDSKIHDNGGRLATDEWIVYLLIMEQNDD